MPIVRTVQVGVTKDKVLEEVKVDYVHILEKVLKGIWITYGTEEYEENYKFYTKEQQVRIFVPKEYTYQCKALDWFLNMYSTLVNNKLLNKTETLKYIRQVTNGEYKLRNIAHMLDHLEKYVSEQELLKSGIAPNQVQKSIYIELEEVRRKGKWNIVPSYRVRVHRVMDIEELVVFVTKTSGACCSVEYHTHSPWVYITIDNTYKYVCALENSEDTVKFVELMDKRYSVDSLTHKYITY